MSQSGLIMSQRHRRVPVAVYAPGSHTGHMARVWVKRRYKERCLVLVSSFLVDYLLEDSVVGPYLMLVQDAQTPIFSICVNNRSVHGQI